MSFLFPGFLYALAALSIPVVVHLFNFRRFKKIPFTNVRFLREVKLQTQSQNKLRHLLVLIARLLALTFLVLAFAQPFIPRSNGPVGDGVRTVSIFIDNSFSMEGSAEGGMLLDVAKNRAIDLALAYAPTDRFLLLTHDFEGRHARLMSREAFVDLVQEVELSPASRSFREIDARQTEALRSAATGNADRYLISDFQAARFSPEDLRSDSTLLTALVVLERNTPSNLYIDSVWFSTPVRKLGETELLTVRIQNAGSERVQNVPLNLAVNGAPRAVGTFSAEPGTATTTTLSYINDVLGFQAATVTIDDHPVSFDDSYHFGYKVYNRLGVLHIRPDGNPEADPFRGIFTGDSVYQYTSLSERRVDYSGLSAGRHEGRKTDFTILSGSTSLSSGLTAALLAFVQGGGSLLLIPGPRADVDSYNALLAETGLGALLSWNTTAPQPVKTLNTEHPLYSGIFEKIPDNPDLPSAAAYYTTSKPQGSTRDVLMALQSGEPYLSTAVYGAGKVYLLAAPLGMEYGNLTRHALFVATALRMAEMSQSTALLQTTLGSDTYFSLPATALTGEETMRLTFLYGEAEFIPRHTLRDGMLEVAPGPDVKIAGNYRLTFGDDTLAIVGLNYSRAESDLSSYTTVQIQEAIDAQGLKGISVFDGNSPALARNVASFQKGTELWIWCLLLALLFLLAETLLLRISTKAAS
jgi:hypothetical protein